MPDAALPPRPGQRNPAPQPIPQCPWGLYQQLSGMRDGYSNDTSSIQ